MTQEVFISQLERALASLPYERVKEILEDIRLHFAEGLAEGRTEEQLSAMLGDPDALAKEYTAMYAVDRAQKNPSPRNVMNVIGAAIGLGILNLMVVLPVGMVIFALWLSFTTLAVSMTLGGIVLTLAALVDYFRPLSFVYMESHLIASLSGIAACSLGLLMAIGMIALGRKMGQATVKYVQSNIQILTHKEV